jgi:hypothetical protein
MSKPPVSKLDGLLRRWADRREASKDFVSLQQQMLATWKESQAGDTMAFAPRPFAQVEKPHRSRRVTGLLAACAASAAMIVAGWFFGLRGKEPGLPAATATSWPKLAHLRESEVRDKADLLRELEKVFDNRLDWVTESGGTMRLEVREDGSPAGLSAAAAPLVVRVTTVRCTPAQPQGQIIGTFDVLMHQEQVVRLSLNAAGFPPGAELAIWAYAVDGALLAVDSSLSLATTSRDSTSSQLQRSGTPSAAYTIKESDGDVKVYQTVVLLGPEINDKRKG